MNDGVLGLPIVHDEKVTVVNDAIESMLYEVVTNPKPGLVDPVSHHSHPDMDVFTFIDSTVTMRPYFEMAFKRGQTFVDNDLRQLLGLIRPDGMDAEKTMFRVTDGVNTHKGAIFVMGIMSAALGYLSQTKKHSLGDLIRTEKKMTGGLIHSDFADVKSKSSKELTAGERQFLKYGKTGIRGEAEEGFPTVINDGMPTLLNSKGDKNEIILTTLLNIVAHSEDSNLIKRAGSPKIVDLVHQDVNLILGDSDLSDPKAKEKLKKMCQEFDDQNLSLGGSADLLILTIFLGKITGNF
ncbi:triphosphoribosyl-dephospho-CoA synthase CitG [Fructilactobacillus fructivorans]|uniref:Probable 2-(5''-triphosphoribosyl)-3'-dephosphocoenzyme-A synthase n=1 Tax=Fructilactobacillus fructivorans TaxID=1614 RepID=A0A0C1M4V8_9LACO|nr:triphosphoribosyl-dephospho-CoA synthase CitG [Fructilactobacillus fructivorans]KID41239.1 2-(5''-triphosphoribosyl)-3'-dephosphocoenzyme- A synthase [Fructilactobacillus fructivorans]MCT0152159.1 triphosphoribosyl-dephospho-CoA synthase CitG [Fructilactobacillus fructivorans]MCT2867758.1 triphosphoribosyl-dephospho-CoA synthase CitG [Fructilactobacillus fructivorans]MCT2868438.1 triphosphoribosyl-dephospho-CoA synthase CitG [Fructilactobacillus fructivorans]MCT2873799.1 triphosphoribosyl-d